MFEKRATDGRVYLGWNIMCESMSTGNYPIFVNVQKTRYLNTNDNNIEKEIEYG